MPEEPETIPPTPAPTPATPNEAPPTEHVESAEKQQLDYANGLFGRKIYELDVPDYGKFPGLDPPPPDRGAARSRAATQSIP